MSDNRQVSPTKIVAAVASVLLVAGCSGSSDGGGKKSDAVPVPKGFDLPAGVTLTKGGTTLTEDKPASVIYQVGDKAASAITVTVTSVAQGLDQARLHVLLPRRRDQGVERRSTST